jgi:EAL domain-containing protein (putative c-di-GMP-specific phosphodiesterase class I)
MVPLVDLAKATQDGWLELWYQPKISVRSLLMLGAEGLLRVRHPCHGVLPPKFFIGGDDDPRFHFVSEAVIKYAIDDWYLLLGEVGAMELAVNLPIAFLRDEALDYLCQNLPHHAAFGGLIVEINGTDVVRNLALAKDIAKKLRPSKVAISLDDVGAECTSLADLPAFPFVEMKVDQAFVKGCASDETKRSMCRQILDLANYYGARTVAEGVETWSDFLAVRELGFDLVQGSLFSKPAPVDEFMATCWPQRGIRSGPNLHADRWTSVSRGGRSGTRGFPIAKC